MSKKKGIIQWKSKRTGKKGEGTAPVFEPEKTCNRLNIAFPNIEHKVKT